MDEVHSGAESEIVEKEEEVPDSDIETSRGPGFTPVPYNAKIADLQENNTTKHDLTLATMGLPLNTKILFLQVIRQSGTGNFRVWPNNGTNYTTVSNQGFRLNAIVVHDQKIVWSGSVANDDFDLHCLGYIQGS